MRERHAEQPASSGVTNSAVGAQATVLQVGSVHGDVHLGAVPPAPTVPRQLPRPGPALIGRADELARLDASLANGGIALLTGMAGVGKTAMAVDWAHRASAGFPGGQLFVDLRGYGPDEPLDAHEVLAGFLRALGFAHPEELTTTGERAAAYRTRTAGRRMLIVLDNARRAEQVRPLLPGGQDSVVIVTCRSDLLGLAVHHSVVALRIEPLGDSDALAVLDEALGERTVADPDGARHLARHCAGLPLALRIAGTQTATLPGAGLTEVVGVLDEVDSPLDALGVDEDDGTALRTVFSWSYQGLSDGEARAFRTLGTHPGPYVDPYVMAAATGGTPVRSAAVLRTLAGRHLVTETEPGRFMAHDLLRAYARELGHPERTVVLTRLYNYYLDVADRADDIVSPLRFRPEPVAPSGPSPSFADREAALAWLDAALPVVVDLCTSSDDRHDDRRWRLAYAIRGYFYLTKRLDAWITTHTAALAATIRLGDPWAEALTRTNLGMALVTADRLEEGNAHYHTTYDLFVRLGDDRGRAGALANIAAVLRRRGALDAALRNQREALTYYRRAEARRHICITLRSMASVETDLGRYADAVRHLEEAISIAIELDLHLETAQAYNALGVTHNRAGEPKRAEAAHRIAADLSRLAGSRHQEATSYRRLGTAALAAGDRQMARRWWVLAARIFEEIGAREARKVIADLAALDG